MQLGKYLSSLAVIAAAVTLSSAQETTSSIFDIITAPNNTLGVENFVSLLSSDPGYDPIINLLQSPGNYTTFIPNNRSITSFVRAWKVYGRVHDLNVTADYPMANTTWNNVTVADLVTYHVLGQRANLSSMTGPVDIENSALNASDVAYFNGSGLPVVIGNNGSVAEWNNQTFIQEYGRYLRYRIGNGNDYSLVTIQDINATNGLVNVINGVLIPPTKPAAVLNMSEDTSILLKVLQTQPDVFNALQNLTNFTLFAPSNDALRRVNFKSLSNNTIQNMILTHLVPGVYYSTNISQAAAANNGNVTVTTFSNQVLPIYVNSTTGAIILNDTMRIVHPNVLFNSGVMHVIDGIFLPSQ